MLVICFSGYNVFSRNIDVAIVLAEMEYNMEKDQIEMMNLSQKIQSVRIQNVKNAALREIANLIYISM